MYLDHAYYACTSKQRCNCHENDHEIVQANIGNQEPLKNRDSRLNRDKEP